MSLIEDLNWRHAVKAYDPSKKVSEEDLRDGAVDILTLLVKSGLAGTRSEARRNVTQGGVTLDGEKVTDFKASYTLDDFSGEG